MTEYRSSLLRLLDERGYIHQVTDAEALDALASKEVVTGYIGFDATAPSLHVGSLVQIMMLRRLQQAGHRPIVLMGGGTTKVGDPSGKDESRKLLTDEEIDANIAGIRRVFERFLTFGDGPTDAVMMNNAEWLDGLEYIAFLREVGQAFHDQPDADLRERQAAARPRAADDLPRVQLHDPPGLRLPRAVAARRLPAADGRVRPVGQYRQRHRAWAADRRRPSCTA